MRSLHITASALSLALLAAPALALLAAPALAHDFKAGAIEIEQPWSRATAATGQTGAAFMVLNNEGQTADRLVSVTSPVADKVQLHTSIMDNGVMEMREVEAVELPADTEVKLAPGGLHLMLIGLKEPLARHKSFPLSLTFEKAGSVTIDVAIQGPGDTAPEPDPDDADDDQPDKHGH